MTDLKDELPLAELESARAANLTRIDEKRARAVSEAEAKAAQAQSEADAAVAQTHADHEAELARRRYLITRGAHEELLPVATRLDHEDTKVDLRAYSAIFLEWQKLAAYVLGGERTHNLTHFAVLGDVWIAKDPGALTPLVNYVTSGFGGFGGHPAELTARLNEALKTGDPATIRPAFDAMQRCVAYAARRDRTPRGDEQARWDAVRFGGSPSELDKLNAEFERKRQLQVAADQQADLDRARRYRRGEDVGEVDAETEARYGAMNEGVVGPLIRGLSTIAARALKRSQGDHSPLPEKSDQ
jgi:hypothetical protein